MSEEQLYDIMCIDEDGYAIAHQREMSYPSAKKEKNRIESLYPNVTYYLLVSVQEEDMFPQY